MSKTLVLIDDDPDDLDIMKEAIQEVDSSLNCISFVYPDEAIRVITSDLIVMPDYIVIDMNMPRKTGMDCLIELRKLKEYKNVPIIIYSTTIRPEVKEALIKAGASHVFQKPAKYDGWAQAIRQIISQL